MMSKSLWCHETRPFSIALRTGVRCSLNEVVQAVVSCEISHALVRGGIKTSRLILSLLYLRIQFYKAD
jgi:hypothetical protein